jgi:hypothetical protein
MGNHDYQEGQNGALVQAMLQRIGIKLLVNASTQLTMNGNTITIVGLDDYYGGVTDIDQAFNGVDDSADFTLALAHNPLHFDDICNAADGKADLILSGHTHAGHVYIPLLKPIYQQVFHHKYRYGVFKNKKNALYVTSGVGSAAFYINLFGFKTGLPRFRFNTNPEIAVFDLF